MANLVTNKKQETAHLRGKSKFYIAGWVANREGEKPQVLPNTHVPPIWEKWHEEYLIGYGDNVANSECLANSYTC
tara:strand:- start:251 stop:475 length:225 start_codon:yes stop_codon:yes gene_type:complete